MSTLGTTHVGMDVSIATLAEFTRLIVPLPLNVA